MLQLKLFKILIANVQKLAFNNFKVEFIGGDLKNRKQNREKNRANQTPE